MVEVYTKWAGTYDNDLCPGRYNGPEKAAKAVSEYYRVAEEIDDTAKISILDVAAGTGRVGEELVKLGFK